MYLAYLSTTYLLPKEGNTHDLTYHLIRPSFVSGQKYTQSLARLATKTHACDRILQSFDKSRTLEPKIPT